MKTKSTLNKGHLRKGDNLIRYITKLMNLAKLLYNFVTKLMVLKYLMMKVSWS